MTDIKQLEKISRCKDFCIFLKYLHGMFEPRSAANEAHIAFANNALDLLSDYESLLSDRTIDQFNEAVKQ